jgi:PGF-pre-PGF domain-containing protein
VYGAIGGYTVTLTVENAAGNSTTSKYGYVLVNEASGDNSERAGQAYFSSSATSGDAPFKVTFHDETEYAPYSSTWTFGDGSQQYFDWTSTSDIPDANHTYLEPGQYTVALFNRHPSGITEITKYHYINVTGLTKPYASFTSEKVSVPKPLTIQFNDTSIGKPTSWFWDFGDGVSSTEQNPMHTYTAEGNYTVNLTAANGNGTDSKLATIKVVKTNPYAYVTNYNSNTVSVIDTTTNKVTATMPVGIRPWGVAVNPDGTRVYVTNWNSNTVSVIDTVTNTVTATVNVGSNPMGIAVAHDGKKIYVTNAMSNNVSVIDSANNTVIATVDEPYHPVGIAVTPDGKKVYVANLYGGVSVFDTATNTIKETKIVGAYLLGIAVSPDGSKVYLTHSDIHDYYNIDSQAVFAINTITNNVTAILGVNGPTTGVIFNQAGTKAYVASWGSGKIYVIDTATNNVTAAVNVGIHPEGIAISPDGSTVYVANEESNNISVIDTNTNAITASINVGNKPVALGQFIASVPVQPLLPRANFSSNVAEGYAPLNVQFIDSSLNKNGWYWDFGDGTNSTNQNPIHTYSSSGNFTVNLTVSNGNSTESKLATIHVSEKPLLPIANFSTNVTSGYAPLSVQFMDDSILTLPPRHQVVTEADNGKSINLENGETFYIRLNECADSDFFWKLNFSPGLCVLSENNIYYPSLEEPVPHGITGMVGGGVLDHVWEIKAVAQGYQQVKGRPSRDGLDKYNFTLNITNLPQNITSGNWDFGDGTYSTELNPIHTYFLAGNYTVNLKVTNANGTDSKNATITVFEKPVLPDENFSVIGSILKETSITNQGQSMFDDGSSNSGSSHSSSSGGGGAGGSPEPQSNVEAKELSQTFIGSGSSVKFTFTQQVTPVVYLIFDSKVTTGKTTTIVEMLKGISTLVSGSPSDEVYKYLNIWVGNGGFGDSKNIENGVVYFKVEKSWIQNKNIDKSSIVLNRYNDSKWNKLPTSVSGEDASYLYYTANTPGFSPFAIIGKTIAIGNGTQTSVNEAQPKNNTSVFKQNTSTASNSGTGSTKTPGFESICGILSLLAVFLHRRK